MKMKNKLFLGLGILGIVSAGTAFLVGENDAVKANAEEDVSYVYDLVKNFSNYALGSSGWGSSYSEKTILSSSLGDESLPAASIYLSNAAKQGTTITDRPVLRDAGNNFITLTDLSYEISSFTLLTKEWTAKKSPTFKIYAEGHESEPLAEDVNCYDGKTYDVPFSGVKTVCFDTLKDSQQVGITSITLTLRQNAVQYECDHIEIANLPSKTSYYIGDSFDLTGISVVGKTADGVTLPLDSVIYSLEQGYVFTKEDVGKKTITVTGTYGEATFTSEFDIDVISGPDITLDFSENYFKSESTKIEGPFTYSRAVETASARVSLHAEIKSGESLYLGDLKQYPNDYQQIGSKDDHISSWYLDTGILANSDSAFIEKVSLTVIKTSKDSSFDISASLGGEPMASEGPISISSTYPKEAVTITFTPSEGKAAYGDVRFSFSNIYSGVGLIKLEVWFAEPTDQNINAAYIFAHKLELIDSCNSEEYADILESYDKLSTAQKEIANEILLDDYIDDMNTRETIGIGSTTVLEKITAIDSRQTTSANGSFIPNESTADNTLYIALGTALGTAALAIAAVVVLKKRHAVSK